VTKMTSDSLILKEQAEIEAAPFFSNFDLPEIDKTKPKFNFTGDRLFRDRPDVYKAVVLLLAEPGVTVRTICRELHVTDDTVRAVKARENISIAAEKKRVLSNITHGLRLASERVMELMPTASARDSLIGVGILGEKMQLLAGDATIKIDIGPCVNHAAELKELHDRITEKFQSMKRAEALEVRPDTGLNGENTEQKALTDGAELLPEIEAASHNEPAAADRPQSPSRLVNVLREAEAALDQAAT
jgi:hypothetical protein